MSESRLFPVILGEATPQAESKDLVRRTLPRPLRATAGPRGLTDDSLRFGSRG